MAVSEDRQEKPEPAGESMDPAGARQGAFERETAILFQVPKAEVEALDAERRNAHNGSATTPKRRQ